MLLALLILCYNSLTNLSAARHMLILIIHSFVQNTGPGDVCLIPDTAGNISLFTVYVTLLLLML